jgi:hypothetical protein
MFTPTDTTDYGTVTASVMLAVTSTAPTITWTAPTAITYGTPLTSAQLDASANVAGAFSYSPGLGAILPAGKQTLSAIFTPSNTSDYSSTTATTTIVVNQATPVIIWELPANIYAGTPLSATQLNAAASGAGSFTYSPAAGTVLPVGTTTLTASFTGHSHRTTHGYGNRLQPRRVARSADDFGGKFSGLCHHSRAAQRRLQQRRYLFGQRPIGWCHRQLLALKRDTRHCRDEYNDDTEHLFEHCRESPAAIADWRRHGRSRSNAGRLRLATGAQGITAVSGHHACVVCAWRCHRIDRMWRQWPISV